MFCNIGCIDMISPQSVLSSSPLQCPSLCKSCYSGCTDMVSPPKKFFEMYCKINILWKVLLKWLYWYSFSPECVSKSFVISPFLLKNLPQWLHLYNITTECVFKCHLISHYFPSVYLKCPIKWILFKKHCHIHCTDMAPPQCESTHVSKK